MNLYWKLGLGALAIAGAFGLHHLVYQSGYDTAVADRAARDAKAVVAKQAENAAEVATKTAMGFDVERKSDAEMAPVVQRIAAAPRLRPGSAICGPAASRKSSGTSQSAAPDTGSGLVREDVDRDLRALKLQVEEALETGRVCQAKLRLEGYMP